MSCNPFKAWTHLFKNMYYTTCVVPWQVLHRSLLFSVYNKEIFHAKKKNAMWLAKKGLSSVEDAAIESDGIIFYLIFVILLANIKGDIQLMHSKNIEFLNIFPLGSHATARDHSYRIYWYIRLAYFPSPPAKRCKSCKSVHSMQQSEMTLMLTTRTPAMDYLSIWLHNRIMELEDELPCKPSKTSGVCVHLNPIYVFNGLRRGVRDRVPPAA